MREDKHLSEYEDLQRSEYGPWKMGVSNYIRNIIVSQVSQSQCPQTGTEEIKS